MVSDTTLSTDCLDVSKLIGSDCTAPVGETCRYLRVQGSSVDIDLSATKRALRRGEGRAAKNAAEARHGRVLHEEGGGRRAGGGWGAGGRERGR